MKLGVIGGSGLYEIDGLTDVESVDVQTPYGEPSGAVTKGRLGDTEIFFLPRHGRGHTTAPHELNYRANICALKLLGAEQLLSVSAVGSMREEIVPGHAVLVDQFIDLTRHRISTFFEDGLTAHVSLADPVCPHLSAAVYQAAVDGDTTVHKGGTYLCMEGPQFSTRAESNLYRSWGVSVIGMTAMPEAKLAREAQLPYALLAFATDYDCWHETEEAVNVQVVIAVLKKNAGAARNTIERLSACLPDPSLSPATTALDQAIITSPEAQAAAARKRLEWLLPK